MKYYYLPASSNCRKVTATADHLGIELERILVNPMKGEQKAPEFLAINPNGKIPALVDGDLKLWESNAIMAYLAGQKDNTLWPKSNARYDIIRWFSWQSAHFGLSIGTAVFERVFKKLANIGPADEAKVEASLVEFQRFGAVLNGHLEGRKFLVGDALTLADFCVASSLTYAGAAQVSLDSFGEIARWNESLNGFAAWRDSAPQM